MLEPVTLFSLGLGLLALGTGLLVRGGTQVARRGGLSPFGVGLVAIGVGFSVAGLAFNLFAVLHERPRLAVGNLVGTNVANVGLVLGLSALVRPLMGSARLISAAIPALLVATLLFWFLCRENEILRVDAGVLLLAFVLVFAYLGRIANQEPDAVRAEFGGWPPNPAPVWLGVSLTLLGVAGLIGGAELAVSGAVEINRTSRVGTPVLGLTSAIGTAFPGLVVALIAARRGNANVVFGIVIGASLSNLLLVAGVAGMVGPLLVTNRALQYEIPLMALFVLLLVTPLATGLQVPRWQGAILLTAVAGFEVWEILR